MLTTDTVYQKLDTYGLINHVELYLSPKKISDQLPVNIIIRLIIMMMNALVKTIGLSADATSRIKNLSPGDLPIAYILRFDRSIRY